MTAITNVGQSSGAYGVTSATGTTSSVGASDTSSLLPEPMCVGGDAVTQLAVLMTRCDAQDQSNSTRVEDAANNAAYQDDQSRVQQMMDKANQDLGSALATGIGEVVGGGLSFAAAVVPSGSASPSSSTRGFDDLMAASANGMASAPSSGGLARALDACGKAAPGVGTIVSAPFKAAADRDDAQAAKFQAASDADVRLYQSAQNRAQADSDDASKIEQTLQSILQTEAATRLKAAGAAG
jgi:hypothetical protein